MTNWWFPPGDKAEKWAPVAHLGAPLHWHKPRAILVRDPFYLHTEAIDMVFAVMALCPRHMFVVMTERYRTMIHWFDGAGFAISPHDRVSAAMWVISRERTDHPHGGFPLPNLQLGTPISTQAEADERIPHLLATPAAHRFVYVTPREPISFEWSRDCGAGRDHGNWLSGFRHDGVLGWAICERIDRVIVGGGKEPMHPDHVRDIRNQCSAAGVPFHFDGWGEFLPSVEAAQWPRHVCEEFFSGRETWIYDETHGVHGWWRVGARRSGRLLDGVTHDAW